MNRFALSSRGSYSEPACPSLAAQGSVRIVLSFKQLCGQNFGQVTSRRQSGGRVPPSTRRACYELTGAGLTI